MRAPLYDDKVRVLPVASSIQGLMRFQAFCQFQGQCYRLSGNKKPVRVTQTLMKPLDAANNFKKPLDNELDDELDDKLDNELDNDFNNHEFNNDFNS